MRDVVGLVAICGVRCLGLLQTGGNEMTSNAVIAKQCFRAFVDKDLTFSPKIGPKVL